MYGVQIGLIAFNLLCDVVVYALLIVAILSWIVRPSYVGRPNFLTRFYYFLCRVTEPIISPARKFMSRFNTGPIDLSLFVTVIFIYLLKRAVNMLVISIF